MFDASSMPSSSSRGSGEDTRKNRMLHGRTSKDSGNEKRKIQNPKELQYGKVSAKELVQAVHDMLSTAGINMDVDKQALLQTTLTLQEQLKESQVALLVEQVHDVGEVIGMSYAIHFDIEAKCKASTSATHFLIDLLLAEITDSYEVAFGTVMEAFSRLKLAAFGRTMSVFLSNLSLIII
ncbi:uncharacterized protein LOC121986593 [Zingiber officinale]|uniref:uncharacterized protein LOC121986593 n=1 Tax=Zingiber officinale TaxID=94328 RepID=UPI001C4ABAB2|nr:uncharacterized protein LOC121986593 [Zingiber officinale]